jgi:hypothetical protein
MSATSSAYGFYSLQTGHLQQAGVQTTGTCTIGNSGVVASNFGSLCATASATSPLFPISRTWDVSQKDHNGAGGLGFRYELGRVMTEVAYTYEGQDRRHVRIRPDGTRRQRHAGGTCR